MIKKNKINQSGSVSIFTVVFAALLIMIITMSFVGIMLQDQEQATAADLSQSAYDSAQAGVEDAKRAILVYESICNDGDESACAVAKADIDSGTNTNLKCNEAINSLGDTVGPTTEGEVKIQTDGSDDLNQAYTCVKIDLDTADYLGSLSANEYKLIPLSGVSAFSSVKIEWFSSENVGPGIDNKYTVNLQNIGTPLLAQGTDSGSWPLNRPSILQTQLIQYGGSFTLGDFEKASVDLKSSNANTLFLYPVSTGESSSLSASIIDIRKTAIGNPTRVECEGSLIGGGYACGRKTKISLPSPIGGGDRTAYLYIGALYNNTDFRVTLYDINNNVVDFNGVQPEIDSTGRANDLFRRVKVRVELTDTTFPYPTAAVNVSGNLCKNFTITNEETDYTNSCNP